MDFCRLNGVSFCTSRTMTMRGHRPGPLDRAWLKINGNGFLTRQIHLFKQPNQTAKILNQKAASPIVSSKHRFTPRGAMRPSR